MTTCFFVSDLHGAVRRYETLFDRVVRERPAALLIGGDLLPSGMASLVGAGTTHRDFINDFLVVEIDRVRRRLGDDAPRIALILGNDDSRFEEAAVLDAATHGAWEYIHEGRTDIAGFTVYGYSFVPPTPFLLKDWERYDVSRYVDPGCVSPEQGVRTVAVSESEKKYSTIAGDLERLAGNADLSRALFLYHTPPYDTKLDRAGLDGKIVDHVPVDVHVGSIAVQRFIAARQPLVTLHGHIHESPRITGSWRDRIGRTHCFSAAHDGPELALVRFELENPAGATRELILFRD